MKFEPWATAYNLLSKKLEKIYPQFQELHIQLRKGGVLIAFKAYIAFMVLISIIAFAAAITLSFILLPLLTRIPILSVMNFAFSLVIAASAAMITLLVMYIYPGMKARNRNGPIDKNLPYITNFLTLLSSSNVPPSLIFESMAKIDTLKEVRLEFSNIIRDIEIFGMDLMTSIVDNSKLTPNDQLGEILGGYVATVRTGGNPTEYLKITTEAVTKDRLSKLDMMLESLSAMAEIYIMLLVAAPLLFIVLLVTLGMIGSGTIAGMSMALVLYLLTYLGIPIMGTIMMVILSTFEK
ncbi:MAG: type II secretion system F family protein [Candidatus Bathyarchaeia archaeon]|jgi:flagellar protein FlaJ